MSQINLNTKFKMTLSLDSIQEYQDYLLEFGKKEIPKKAKKIVSRVTTEGLKNNYKSTKKIATKVVDGKVTGGIKATQEKDTYKEFGTGIIGSGSPHPDTMSGWQYDVNEHGEKGWKYPKGDGTYGWTRGIPAQKKFYNSMKDMEKSFAQIAQKVFKEKE